jgi:hypothetical protein
LQSIESHPRQGRGQQRGRSSIDRATGLQPAGSGFGSRRLHDRRGMSFASSRQRTTAFAAKRIRTEPGLKLRKRVATFVLSGLRIPPRRKRHRLSCGGRERARYGVIRARELSRRRFRCIGIGCYSQASDLRQPRRRYGRGGRFAGSIRACAPSGKQVRQCIATTAQVAVKANGRIAALLLRVCPKPTVAASDDVLEWAIALAV